MESSNLIYLAFCKNTLKGHLNAEYSLNLPFNLSLNLVQISIYFPILIWIFGFRDFSPRPLFRSPPPSAFQCIPGGIFYMSVLVREIAFEFSRGKERKYGRDEEIVSGNERGRDNDLNK